MFNTTGGVNPEDELSQYVIWGIISALGAIALLSFFYLVSLLCRGDADDRLGFNQELEITHTPLSAQPSGVFPDFRGESTQYNRPISGINYTSRQTRKFGSRGTIRLPDLSFIQRSKTRDKAQNLPPSTKQLEEEDSEYSQGEYQKPGNELDESFY